MRMGPWSETEHLDQYLELIGKAPGGARAQTVPRSTFPRPSPADASRETSVFGAGPRERRSEDRQRQSPAQRDLGEGAAPLSYPRCRLAGAVPVLALLALACCLFRATFAHPAALIVDGERPSIDHANPGEPRGIGNDVTFFFLPHHLSIARAIRTFGHLPLWDDRGFGGRPLAGNPQGGMFYPPVWLVWWSGSPSALGWLTVLHLLWGGIGTYVLMRSFQLGRWGATVAAAIYQASPFLLAHTFEGHYPHVWAACWYPWAFWAYGQHRSNQGRGRLLLPVILALTYLTGHPQEWFLLILALTAWSLFDAWNTWRAHGPGRRPAGSPAGPPYLAYRSDSRRSISPQSWPYAPGWPATLTPLWVLASRGGIISGT